MGDYHDTVTRKAVDSTILRVYPGAVVSVYTSGTSTLIAQVTADANGNWSVASLSNGKYDIKVDGQLVRTIQFVKSDHTHKSDQTWIFFHSGALTVDFDADNAHQVFGTEEAGSIIKIKVQASFVSAVGDVRVHLLKGASGGASALTFAADSAWNHRINPLAIKYRYLYVDSNPGITMAINDVIQLGVDYTALSVEGLTVIVIFRPNP